MLLLSGQRRGSGFPDLLAERELVDLQITELASTKTHRKALTNEALPMVLLPG